MATTTNYAWETPDDTDLVKDGAAAIRTLGSSVDTTTKALNPSTTLGDIEYRSATANTNTRLAIGTSGQLLAVNGSGVPAWTTVPTGFDSVLNFEESGLYLTTREGTSTSASATVGQTFYVPIFLAANTFDRIGFRVGSTLTTAGNTRLGLYNCSTTTGKPTTVVFDAGVVNATAANQTLEITISQSISAGWYFLAINLQSGNYGYLAYSDALSVNGLATTVTGTKNKMWLETGVTGAFATAGTVSLATLDRYPTIALRIA